VLRFSRLKAVSQTEAVRFWLLMKGADQQMGSIQLRSLHFHCQWSKD